MTERPAHACETFIGTSGWSYEDWKNRVYPAGSRVDRLEYLSRYFDALEINVTFYRALPASTSEKWLATLEPRKRFLFTAKLFQGITHLQNCSRSDLESWLAGIQPLREAGRLGAVLMQFPWSFRYSESAVDYIRRLRDQLDGYPLVVEFRHDSWLSERVFEFLREQDIGFCNIDQPAHDHYLPPTQTSTSKVSYVRLHGRNQANWFEHEQAFERYDYLYQAGEIAEWTARIEEITAQADRLFVFANNHYHGQAAANALQIRASLFRQAVEVPPLLLDAFPQLQQLCSSLPLRQQQLW